MKNALRGRFWLETLVAIATGMFFLVTLVKNDWIEIVFHVDPDSNNGTFEWFIVGVLLIVTITLFTMARYEWRRARAAIS